MENNVEYSNTINVVPEVVEETKTCKCCGRTLPLSDFNRKGTGYRNICKSCERGETGASDKFKEFTSRELILELRERGYEGTLTKKIIETIKL